MTMHGICHIEFESTDLERSQKFYATLFGWSFRSFGESMVVFGQGEDHIGGISKVDEVQTGNSPSVWFQAGKLEDYCDQAQRLGGQVVRERTELPGVGWTAVLADPDGNPVGLVQYASS